MFQEYSKHCDTPFFTQAHVKCLDFPADLREISCCINPQYKGNCSMRLQRDGTVQDEQRFSQS